MKFYNLRKRLKVLKFQPKLNLKFIPKGSKTIKIIKWSKNRRDLTKVKAILFSIEANKKYRYIMTTRKSILENIVSGCVVRSEHRIDMGTNI